MCPLFFFNDTATTEIYTLSLHDALPIFLRYLVYFVENKDRVTCSRFLNTFDDSTRHGTDIGTAMASYRSEEHTSELQSRQYVVCRLLLEKKKQPLNYQLGQSRRHQPQPV